MITALGRYTISAVLISISTISPSLAQSSQIQINSEIVLESTAAHAGTSIRGAISVQLEQGYHVNSNAPLDESLIPTVLNLDTPQGIRSVGLVYPEAVLFEQIGLVEPLAVFEEEFTIGFTLAISKDLPVDEYIIPVTLRYQACDETMCYMPSSLSTTLSLRVVPVNEPIVPIHSVLFAGLSFDEQVAITRSPSHTPRQKIASGTQRTDNSSIDLLDQFTVVGTAGGYLNSEDFLEFVAAAESGSSKRGWFEGRGPLTILIIVLIGGLALNLTPCVLPMVPINLAIIGAGTQARSRSRGFALGATYGAAMALVYGVLGLVVILTAGTFGTINSSPWFNLAIAVIFVVLGLAMFDLVAIDLSHLQNKFQIGSGGRGSFFIAFGMGAIAALLAGACVAPVVIQVILFASSLYATGVTGALLLPFFLGLGMALPWPIAGAGLSFLPKPGIWMVRVKQVLGIFILATASYYGYLSYEIFSNRWVDATEVTDSVKAKIESGWYDSLSEGLATARTENKLVLVDVWATWCKNCLVMDQTTFEDPEVLTRIENYVKIKFRAEDPSASPAKQVLDQFESIGLPTYAILRPPAKDPDTS